MGEVKGILLGMATTQQTCYVAIDVMMAEIVALRETVRALDPTFSEVMDQKRMTAVASLTESREAMNSSLETCLRLIQRLPD